MKRMVKNGDLLDISEDGSSATFGGNLKVGGTIIANGEVRGGDVSASKFLLGTEEMPLVKANPAGDATGTLEKIKIGDVAYKVGGGSDYTAGSNIKISEAKEIAVKSNLSGIDSIKLSPSNGATISGTPTGIISLRSGDQSSAYPEIDLVRYDNTNTGMAKFQFLFDSTKNTFIVFNGQGATGNLYPFLARGSKVPFVPSGDGTYVLKATVSGGSVTYNWVAE